MISSSSLPPSADPTSAAAPRVLVVDDDEHIRTLIVLALSDEGYEVNLACNGEVALELAAACRPDVILLDINMPVMDGTTFAERYRATPGPHAPVVVFTAGHAAEAIAAAIAADDYLDKPFDIGTLVTTIEGRGARSSQ